MGAVPATSMVSPFQRASTVSCTGLVTSWQRQVPAHHDLLLFAGLDATERHRRGQLEGGFVDAIGLERVRMQIRIARGVPALEPAKIGGHRGRGDGFAGDRHRARHRRRAPDRILLDELTGELLAHPVADVHVLARRDDPGAVRRGPITRGRIAVGGRQAGLGRRVVGEHIPRGETGSGQNDDHEREEDEADRGTEHELRS